MKSRFFTYISGLLFAFGIFLFTATRVSASEGTFELRSTTRDTYRCFAASILMQDLNYSITVSCRDLIYPAGNTVFTYVLWAQPIDGGSPRRLGELGYGRLATRWNQPFNQLFVTTEQDSGVGKPVGPVVMRGNVQQITFLDHATAATPTISNGQPSVGGQDITPTPVVEASTGSKLVTALRRAGLAALLALLALVGLVFAITRTKG